MANYLLYSAGDKSNTAGGFNACIVADDTSSTHAIAGLLATGGAPNNLGNPAPIGLWNAVVLSSVTSTDIPSTVWFQGNVASPYVRGRGV